MEGGAPALRKIRQSIPLEAPEIPLDTETAVGVRQVTKRAMGADRHVPGNISTSHPIPVVEVPARLPCVIEGKTVPEGT